MSDNGKVKVYGAQYKGLRFQWKVYFGSMYIFDHIPNLVHWNFRALDIQMYLKQKKMLLLGVLTTP